MVPMNSRRRHVLCLAATLIVLATGCTDGRHPSPTPPGPPPLGKATEISLRYGKKTNTYYEFGYLIRGDNYARGPVVSGSTVYSYRGLDSVDIFDPSNPANIVPLTMGSMNNEFNG